MRRRIHASALLAALLAFWAAPGAQAQESCAGWGFCLYIPAFHGQGALGLNVATVLNLQVWKTFRRTPYVRPPAPPSRLNFGSAGIAWDTAQLPAQTHKAAERALRNWRIGGQMVLWGEAYQYGDGVAVQPRLSMPLYEDGRETQHEIWRLSVGGETLSVDLPSRRYELSPILLDRDVVARYEKPNAILVYRHRTGDEVIGRIGDSFVGEIIEPSQARIRYDGDKRGWIRYGGLERGRSAVVEFVSALIRIHRADWVGAASALARAVENNETKPRLRIDAQLLLGMARERAGRDGRAPIARALAAAPYSRVAVQYMVMSHLSGLARPAGDAERRATAIKAVRGLLDAKRQLFAKDDPWLNAVRRGLERTR